TESTYVWNELLQDINSRGVQEVLLFITDGLKGMKDTIHQIYPKAKYQHCCIHVSRNIAHKVRVKDRKEICDDFKAVYQANSKEEANTFLSGMIEKWKKNYPKVT
ncbi:transposase, partial [Enterococcus faecium]